MKHYKELINLQCFTRLDVEHLTGSSSAADSLLSNYQRKGYIRKVKRNLYVAMSLETGAAVPSRYFIASHITDGSYLTHHSAFEYYGYANQVFFEVYVSGGKRFAPFSFDEVTYRYAGARIEVGVELKAGGIRVTDLERTVLDSLADFEKLGGLEELLRSLHLVPYLSEEKMLEYLRLYNRQILYQKAGYILSHFKQELRLTEDFFNSCERNVKKSVRYLYHGIQHEPNLFDRRWQLFVPQSLMRSLSQGVQFDEGL